MEFVLKQAKKYVGINREEQRNFSSPLLLGLANLGSKALVQMATHSQQTHLSDSLRQSQCRPALHLASEFLSVTGENTQHTQQPTPCPDLPKENKQRQMEQKPVIIFFLVSNCPCSLSLRLASGPVMSLLKCPLESLEEWTFFEPRRLSGPTSSVKVNEAAEIKCRVS